MVSILDELQTIDKLIQGYSISRYGDGEIVLCSNRSISFQHNDPELTKRLINIVTFKEKHDNLLVALPPLIFGRYSRYGHHVVKHWQRFASLRPCKHFLKTMVNLNGLYGSSFISRCNEVKPKHTSIMIARIKEVWRGRKVVYLINEKNKVSHESKIPIVFGEAASMDYYFIPPENAWCQHTKIIEEVKNKYDTSYLLICSGGPTATVLAYDFTVLGYQFIDLGHFVHLI